MSPYTGSVLPLSPPPPRKTGAIRAHFAKLLIPREERRSLNSTVAHRRPKKGDTVSHFSKRSKPEGAAGFSPGWMVRYGRVSTDVQEGGGSRGGHLADPE